MQNTFDSQASIFTGQEEIFAFERTVSRLTEMQGEEILDQLTTHTAITTTLIILGLCVYLFLRFDKGE